MLKYALSKYFIYSSAFDLFNLIASKLPFLISLMGCVGLCYTSTYIHIITKTGKDSTHGQQERQRIFIFCPL